MIIEKNDKAYVVTEKDKKWIVKLKKEKLEVSFEISRDICSTAEAVKEYLLTNDEFF